MKLISAEQKQWKATVAEEHRAVEMAALEEFKATQADAAATAAASLRLTF